MASAQSLLCLICVALCLAPLATAESISCIVFANYYSPYHTYKIVHDVKTNGECCSLCAEDEKCLAWSRARDTNLCALKNDIDVLMEAGEVDSGIKYRGGAVPKLIKNEVGAEVILGKEITVVKKQPTRVSARAVAVSTGGRSSASVSASPDGVKSTMAVTGSGFASTEAETPEVSLAAALKKERGSAPDYVVAYYKKPKYVAQVVTYYGKRVQIFAAKNDELFCYACGGFPCFYSAGLSYIGGYAVAEFEAVNVDECCGACKLNDFCLSWWWDPLSKKCVLNSDLPQAKAHDKLFAGTVL